VCVFERERERQTDRQTETYSAVSYSSSLNCVCVCLRERERETESDTHSRLLAHFFDTTNLICMYILVERYIYTRWLRSIGSLKLQVSFAKEPYKRDDFLQKRPIILRSLLLVATPWYWMMVYIHTRTSIYPNTYPYIRILHRNIKAHPSHLRRLCR